MIMCCAIIMLVPDLSEKIMMTGFADQTMEIITVNAGGTLFATSKATLNCEPSVFADLIANSTTGNLVKICALKISLTLLKCCLLTKLWTPSLNDLVDRNHLH